MTCPSRCLNLNLGCIGRTKDGIIDYSRISPEIEPICTVMMTLTKRTLFHCSKQQQSTCSISSRATKLSSCPAETCGTLLQTCKALQSIQPTNDLCEGILGLNDWLQKQTPNFSQSTVSGMVEILNNSTMPWFWKQDRYIFRD